MKVITIGGATHDLFIVPTNTSVALSYDENFHEFSLSSPKDKINIKATTHQSGGGATNSAVAFARQGITTSCIISLGNDANGKRIRTELETEGIETAELTLSNDNPTGEAFIVCQPPSSKHLIFVDRGANEHLSLATINRDVIRTSDLLYITSLGQQATKELPELCAFAHQNGVKIAHNPGQWELTTGIPFLTAALPTLEILILNHQEARQLEASLHSETPAPPSFDIKHFLHKIHSYGVTTIVITNGKHGVYVSRQDRILFHQSLTTTVINTVGAGDSFGSIFSASLLENNDLEVALLHGLLSSQSVIQQIGAKKGLLTRKQLIKVASNYNFNLLQEIKPLF